MKSDHARQGRGGMKRTPEVFIVERKASWEVSVGRVGRWEVVALIKTIPLNILPPSQWDCEGFYFYWLDQWHLYHPTKARADNWTHRQTEGIDLQRYPAQITISLILFTSSSRQTTSLIFSFERFIFISPQLLFSLKFHILSFWSRRITADWVHLLQNQNLNVICINSLVMPGLRLFPSYSV